jgi:hypothetical protein
MPDEFASDAGTPENSARDLAEGRELPGVGGIVEQFRGGEVAHHQRNAVIAGIDARDDALRLGYRQSEPVHAGIDVNGGAARPAGAAAEHVPFGEFVEVADHGLAVDSGVGVAGVLEEAAEHIDRSRGRSGANHARLVEGGDEKRLAAGGSKRAAHLFGAAAIGIRLDDSRAFGRHRRLLELAPVGDDGVEIDRQHAGGRHERGAWFASARAGCLAEWIWDRGDVHAAFYAAERGGSTAVAVNSRDPAGGRPARDR